MAVISLSPRLKREDCKRTPHDSVFSKWKIFIGSCDWEDYSLGKDGVQRYRTYNLSASSSCPGLYELGLAAISSADEGRRHDAEKVIVVYLGQTNNVRTRLQRYGRVGAHLESVGKLLVDSSSLNENECSGLFTEVFSRGFSIMFRWAPMIDKKEAENKEAELLAAFDYAWNKCANGACRREQILSNLDSKTGIDLDASAPYYEEQKGFLLPKVLKFGNSQVRFINGEGSRICGVAIGNGLVCKNQPVFGKRRCEEHKGKKLIGTDAVSSNRVICGVALDDGFLCAELPCYGRKRCEVHKGRRITRLELDIKHHVEELYENCEPQPTKEEAVEHAICGFVCGDETVCRNRPVWGRKRCEYHKGRRVTRIDLNSVAATKREIKGSADVCGFLVAGCVCMRKPVSGRKRCEEHKGRRIKVMLSSMSTKQA